MLRIISRLHNNLTLNPSSGTPQGLSSCHLFSTVSFPLSSTQILRRRQQDGDVSNNEDPGGPPRLFVVQPRFRPEPILRTKLEEALNLANSLEQQRNGFYDTLFSDKEFPPHLVVQNPLHRFCRADTYFRKGTVDNIRCHLNALDSQEEVDAVFVNASLTGIQQRNLERIWGKPVLDRVGLIIEIFNAHAETKEAKLQAELAALMYKRSRLVRVRGVFGESAEVVSARGRGGSGRGFISGAGETELQLQRRRISDRRTQLLLEIKEVRRTRAVQRAARRGHGKTTETATVAVVGYTNAGKSTLVSKLSDSKLYCDDRLFATVDPKLRSVILPSGHKALLSDTVGFVSDLPVQLVEAFKATLEEVVEADLLVHVLDSSAPNLDEQRDVVLQVLRQIGVSEEKLGNMIEVWNKIDRLGQEAGCDELAEAEEVTSLVDPDEDDGNDSGTEVYESEVSSSLAEGDMEAEEGDDAEGWLLSGEEEEEEDYKDSGVLEDTARLENRMDVGNVVESITRVKTSALTGFGLQELLQLVDEKLDKRKEAVVERSIFSSKWRPPRSKESASA